MTADIVSFPTEPGPATGQGGANEPFVLAVPKGRILKELRPILRHVGVEPVPRADPRRRMA